MKKKSIFILRKKSFSLLILALVVALFSFACRQESEPDEFGLPSEVRSSVLIGAIEDSKIISAQMVVQISDVTQMELEMWCVVTESNGGREQWIATDAGSPEGRPLVGILRANGPNDFRRIGCTNWDD